MKKFRKVVSLLICLLMVCSILAGCGGDGSSSSNTSMKGINGYVYTSEFKKIEGNNNNCINDLVRISNDKFAYYISEYIRTEDMDINYGGEYKTNIYTIDLEGNVTCLENYKNMEKPSVDGVNEDEISIYVSKLLALPDGKLATIENISYSIYTGPKDVEMYTDEWYNKGYYDYMKYRNDYYLRTLDETGNEISSVNLSANIPEEYMDYFYFGNCCLLSDGTFAVTSDMSVYVLDINGNFIRKIDTDNYIDNLFVIHDKLYAMLYVMSDESGSQQIGEFDLTTGKLSNSVEAEWFWRIMDAPAGSEYDFYYPEGTYLKGFKLADGSNEPILNWINSDVNSDNISNGFMLDDGRIFLVENNWSTNYDSCESYSVVLTKIPVNEAAKKTIISYAGAYVDYQDRAEIIKFNKSNDEYRIEVTDYSQFNTDEDYTAGITKLKTEILAGQVPDIINLEGLDYETLAKKGILADFYELMDENSEIQKEDILEPIRNILEIDGHLYRTASSFRVNTCIGASSIVGENDSWTVEDYREALAKLPEGASGFNYSMTKSEMLNNLLSLEMNNLIDWSTGECKFDTDLFKSMLAFANEFPAEFDWDSYEYTNESEQEYRIANGLQMLINDGVYNIETFMQYDAAFGGNANFIGYPVTEGNGSSVSLDYGTAISATSSVKDQAWAFVQKRFTKDYQADTWQFPTNTEKFNEMVKEAKTTEYQQDWDGNYILDDKGQKIVAPKGQYGWTEGTMVEFYEMTDAQEAKLMALLNGVKNISNYDSSINETVFNEAESYFAGDKTVDEVAKLIQSKVTIYVNEQM